MEVASRSEIFLLDAIWQGTFLARAHLALAGVSVINVTGRCQAQKRAFEEWIEIFRGRLGRVLERCRDAEPGRMSGARGRRGQRRG
jgi:hypothetical protein